MFLVLFFRNGFNKKNFVLSDGCKIFKGELVKSLFQFSSNFIFVFLSCVSFFYAQPQNLDPSSLHKIVQTQTWKELDSQPLIYLKGGTKIRLGLEQLDTPAFTGTFLYGLVEGNDFIYPQLVEDGEILLGPLKARIYQKDLKLQERLKKFVEEEVQMKELYQKYRLYTAFIPVNGEGTYLLQLYDFDEKLVASALLNATKERFHFWTTLIPLEKNLQEEDLKTFTNRNSFTAFPIYSIQREPLIQKNEQSYLDIQRENLPSSFNFTISSDFFISFQNKILTVQINRSKRDYLPIEKFFLCRWWVNEQPFPEEPFYFEQKLRLLEKKFENTHEKLYFQIKLEVDLEMFEANLEDKIELQLLYCPNMLEKSHLENILLSKEKGLRKRHLPSESTSLLLSNRVELKNE